MRHPPFLDSFSPHKNKKGSTARDTKNTTKTLKKNTRRRRRRKEEDVLPSFFSFSGEDERGREKKVSFLRRGRVSSSRRRLFYSIGRARERATPRGEGREGGGEYVVNVLGERNAFTTSTRDEEEEDDDALLDRARIFCESLDRRVVSSRVRQRRGERKDVGWK